MRYLPNIIREIGQTRTWTERLYLISPLGQALLKDLSDATGAASARDRKAVDRMAAAIAADGAAQSAVLGEGAQLKVRWGPFAGMLYEDFASGSVFGAKILGTYEDEIATWFEAALDTDYTHFIDVGCAEGYYAVGVALRRPDWAVSAFDINPAAQAMTARLAKINAVSDRVAIEGLCAADNLQALLSKDRALLLVDIEGFEDFLLDPGAVPALANTDIIVETHEHTMPGVTFRLLARFGGTHRIDAIAAVPDEWKAAGVVDDALKLSAREGRRLPQVWLRLRSRAAGDTLRSA